MDKSALVAVLALPTVWQSLPALPSTRPGPDSATQARLLIEPAAGWTTGMARLGALALAAKPPAGTVYLHERLSGPLAG